MRYINFSNVEQVIFEDEKTHKLFPSYFSNYFETWKLGKRMPMFRQLGKEALLDLLNSIRNEHLNALEGYFGERIVVEKLYYDTVRNLKIPLDKAEDACNQLCDVVGFNYFSTWRDGDYLYISLWR